MRGIYRSAFRPTLGRGRRLVVTSFLLSVAVLGLPLEASAVNADLILYGGKIVTVDSGFTFAEAVAVKAGRIVAVGATADIVSRERGPQTQMIDLKGRTSCPV